MSSPAIRRVSSAESTGRPGTTISPPFQPTCGIRPGEKIRLLTFAESPSMAVIISLVGSGASEPAGANKPAKASESPFSIGVIRPHLLAENLFGGNHNLSWKGRFQQVTLVAPL